MKQRVVVQFIAKKDSKILLLKRSQGRPGLVGKYELPGGAISNGEQPEDALRRHLENSLGLHLAAESLTLVDVLSFNSRDEGDIQNVLVVYEYSAGIREDTLRLGSSYNDFNFFGSDKLPSVELRDSAKLILDIYLGTNNVSAITSNDDKKATNVIEYTIYSDGGSRGNPGHSASAFVIFDTNGQVVDKGGEYIGVTTNNQAEYQAVLLGLERAVNLELDKIDFRIDSMLVVNQLKGLYAIKNRELWPIHERIKSLLGHFSSVKFTHVPREMNQEADALVNDVLDQHQNGA